MARLDTAEAAHGALPPPIGCLFEPAILTAQERAGRNPDCGQVPSLTIDRNGTNAAGSEVQSYEGVVRRMPPRFAALRHNPIPTHGANDPFSALQVAKLLLQS